jgi:enamine deaminase RidA (YjgF/YER057c/UK114 family)
VPDVGIEQEARNTFEYIKRTLAALGADMSHVVKINAFLTDLADYDAYAAVRASYFGDQLPASASVGVRDLLLGAHLEVDALAFIPDA